jgi:hypothetical protein
VWNQQLATAHQISHHLPQSLLHGKHLLLLCDSLHVCPGMIEEMLSVIIFDQFSNPNNKVYIGCFVYGHPIIFFPAQ